MLASEAHVLAYMLTSEVASALFSCTGILSLSLLWNATVRCNQRDFDQFKLMFIWSPS